MCGEGDGFDMIIIKSLSLSSYAKQLGLIEREGYPFFMAGVEFLLSCCPAVLSRHLANKMSLAPVIVISGRVLLVSRIRIAAKTGILH